MDLTEILKFVAQWLALALSGAVGYLWRRLAEHHTAIEVLRTKVETAAARRDEDMAVIRNHLSKIESTIERALERRAA